MLLASAGPSDFDIESSRFAAGDVEQGGSLEGIYTSAFANMSTFLARPESATLSRAGTPRFRFAGSESMFPARSV